MKNDSDRPVIGITMVHADQPVRTYDTVAHDFARSVIMAGGLPLLIPVLADLDLAAHYLDMLDGLLLTGGNGDVDPALYGEEPILELRETDPERDAWEIALLSEAWDRDMPVLGVCRGLQLMNVARGGSLYQNLGVQVDGVGGHFPSVTAMNRLFHSVSIEAGSRLHKIFGEQTMRVNSFHNLAAKIVGKGFQVTARAMDGVIEGIEAGEKRFMVGVQWHPEALTREYPAFLDLFRALVQASGE